jgi:hypothetical protein
MTAFTLNQADLAFVLRQIKVAEAHATGSALTSIYVDAAGNVVPQSTPGAVLAIPDPHVPVGLRTVDGSYNNVVPGRELWGAADPLARSIRRPAPIWFRTASTPCAISRCSALRDGDFALTPPELRLNGFDAGAFADNFDTAAFTNSTGSTPWTTAWVETNDDGVAQATIPSGS